MDIDVISRDTATKWQLNKQKLNGEKLDLVMKNTSKHNTDLKKVVIIYSIISLRIMEPFC